MAFPLSDFRLLYPAFASVTDGVVLAVSVQAECFIAPTACGCTDQAWMLATAHMLALRNAAASGNTQPGLLTGATVGGVSVSYQAPATGTSAYRFWLAGSPYGIELMALLKGCSVGGVLVGGYPERAAFRRVGGGFPNRGRVN